MENMAEMSEFEGELRLTCTTRLESTNGTTNTDTRSRNQPSSPQTQSKFGPSTNKEKSPTLSNPGEFIYHSSSEENGSSCSDRDSPKKNKRNINSLTSSGKGRLPTKQIDPYFVNRRSLKKQTEQNDRVKREQAVLQQSSKGSSRTQQTTESVIAPRETKAAPTSSKISKEPINQQKAERQQQKSKTNDELCDFDLPDQILKANRCINEAEGSNKAGNTKFRSKITEKDSRSKAPRPNHSAAINANAATKAENSSSKKVQNSSSSCSSDEDVYRCPYCGFEDGNYQIVVEHMKNCAKKRKQKYQS